MYIPLRQLKTRWIFLFFVNVRTLYKLPTWGLATKKGGRYTIHNHIWLYVSFLWSFPTGAHSLSAEWVFPLKRLFHFRVTALLVHAPESYARALSSPITWPNQPSLGFAQTQSISTLVLFSAVSGWKGLLVRNESLETSRVVYSREGGKKKFFFLKRSEKINKNNGSSLVRERNFNAAKINDDLILINELIN